MIMFVFQRLPTLLLLLLTLCVLLAVTAKCPDLTTLRTDNVLSNYNTMKMDGFWYEVAYEDLAQLGESCQYYNKTVIATSTDKSNSNSDVSANKNRESDSYDINEQFGFTYLKPRHMNLKYSHTEDIAIYKKAVTLKDSTSNSDYDSNVNYLTVLKKGFSIPTVVVDFINDESDNSYKVITEYSCYSVGPIAYQEIRIGSREPTISDEDMKTVVDSLESVGINTNRIKAAKQSDICVYG